MSGSKYRSGASRIRLARSAAAELIVRVVDFEAMDGSSVGGFLGGFLGDSSRVADDFGDCGEARTIEELPSGLQFGGRDTITTGDCGDAMQIFPNSPNLDRSPLANVDGVVVSTGGKTTVFDFEQ